MKIRFGICGLGFAGSVLMAPDLKAHPNVELVAACDPNADVRDRFTADYRIAGFGSLGEMLREARLDAVYIASPHQFHAEHVIEAAAHGVHVIVEKPLTLSAADGERIVEAVEKAGIHLVVGPSRGNDPVVRTMRDLVLSGEVGRVAMVNCWNYTDFLYRPRRPEELDTSKGGGIIFNQLPHAIDSVKAISNQKVVAVRAIAGSLDPQRPTEGHCAAFLTLADGAAASIVYSGYDHFDSDELQFWIGEVGNPKTASHGSARKVLRELKGREQDLRVQRYGYGGPVAQGLASLQAKRKQSHFGMMLATCERADLRPSPDGVLVYGDEGVREVPAVRTRGDNRLSDTTIDELYDAVTGRAPVLRDARWGLDTVRVCQALLDSSRTGEQITL
ncbi:Gfo/Idh/MocA family oxidoreductase [Ramlibacter tataouinensis]|uniref:Gfo/Idh/MocA family protein n=1 Tax=Ramlibacter tataouinensis TaxID=94132 RepID=UPI0022F39796|nr:Gfo/Idh/MocA family oxidoreductase [Ramlibacter tataouinensis]WBY02384.1 Gfo/Idh/MocA family oxidoreductase [Ramlibacter tataouinensis]